MFTSCIIQDQSFHLIVLLMISESATVQCSGNSLQLAIRLQVSIILLFDELKFLLIKKALQLKESLEKKTFHQFVQLSNNEPFTSYKTICFLQNNELLQIEVGILYQTSQVSYMNPFVSFCAIIIEICPSFKKF